MTTDAFPFKVLFWFEDDSKIITEIKRTDIQSEDKSLVYKWLMIRKQNENENEKQNEPVADLQSQRNKNEKCISVLTFQSMDQSHGDQIRYFAEGRLNWNAGTVSFNNEKMVRIEPEHLANEWLELISQFLV